MSRYARLALALVGISLAACGDGDTPADCEGADCEDPSGSESLLGNGAASYAEANEAANGASASAEPTGYVLEADEGLAIAGEFEGASPTPDAYAFNSGAQGTAREPGFPGVDVRIVIDGEALDTGGGVSLGLDTVKEFGYSSLSGSGYFMNAALITGEDYVLRLTPAASLAGKRYTIEIKGRPAQP